MPTDEELWAALESKCTHAPEFKMFATRGTNLIAVGWDRTEGSTGVLRCCFASKDGPRYGKHFGVPEAEFGKLKRSPYPDRLYTTNIKGKYPYEKEAA